MPVSQEKRDLLARAQEAIQMSGWQMIFENDDHPSMIRAFRAGDSLRMLVYIWRLTRGGPAGVRPAGEFRIQLTGVDAPLRRGQGFTTLLLGWHEPLEVFAGFDVARRPVAWGRSPSVQIRADALETAAETGFGTYRRATGTGELAVAFSPGSFIDYARNQSRFHDFASHPDEVRVLNEVIRHGGEDAGEEDEDEPTVDLGRIGSQGRRQVIRTVQERIGQENFRLRVLAAYKHHCAMCTLQLNLVAAAHIVPVASDGTNETSNGLALCYLHHEAYDRGFVTADRDYRIRVSEAARHRLRRLRRNSREQEFIDSLRADLFLPERRRDCPTPEYLTRGMELRGWPTTAA